MSVYSQSIEIRTKSVEKVLEPIILQLSALVNPQRQLNGPKGLSKSGEEILNLVKITTDEFVDRGKEILRECPKMAEDFTIVLKDIQVTGDQLSQAISIFVAQPTNENQKKNVSRSAKSLLSSVTRLLILADLVDVQRLRQCLQRLKEDVSYVKSTTDMGELTALFTPINNALSELFALLQPRTQDLLNQTQREDLDLSQYCLRQACNMLLAASKAHLTHPELATAAANRVYCAQLVCHVIDRISDASDTTCLPEAPSPLQGQAVMSILQEIMDMVRTESAKEDNRNGAGLSLALDQLSAEISALENSANLGERIHTSLEASLQHLRNEISELLDMWEFQATSELGSAVDSITDLCFEIRHLIAKAALALSAGTFLAGDMAVALLTEAARAANENRLIVAAENIQTQTTELIDAALCLCALSTDPNSIRFARFTAAELEQLTPQLINASKVLALRPTSTAAMGNYSLFSTTYKSFVEMLQTAMDDLTDSTDLLITYDELLREDLASCERQAAARQIPALMRDSKTFSARSLRVCSFLLADLEFYGLHGNAVDKITSAVGAIQERFLTQFSSAAKEACRRIKANEAVQVNLIHQAGETVLDRFQDLRETLEVLFGQKRPTLDSKQTSTPSEDFSRRQDGDLGSATLSAHSDRQGQSRTQHLTTRSPSLIQEPELRSAAAVCDSTLSSKIAEFYVEKTRFLEEFDNKNISGEVFTLARSMCFLLGDMTEYTLGTGVIRTEVELIQTAREISQLGSRLKYLCNSIVDQCPDSIHKRDLLMYMNRIALYSHQLNILSRVKADVRNLSGELGLDNALSLVVSAKNLMSAVSAAVKESYIATKLPGTAKTPDLCWQLPIPHQRPLLEVSTGGRQSPVDSPQQTFNQIQRVDHVT